MGCTVSGVEKRNCEWFVCGQEKSIIKAIKAPSGSNSLQFSTCGKELEQSSLKSNEKSDELGESTILRSTHSGRNFSSKMFEELPSIKGSSNSNEIDARVTLFKNLNKDPFCHGSYRQYKLSERYDRVRLLGILKSFYDCKTFIYY